VAKRICVNTDSHYHEHALHCVFKISSRVNVAESQSSHRRNSEENRIYVFLDLGNIIEVIFNQFEPVQVLVRVYSAHEKPKTPQKVGDQQDVQDRLEGS